MDELVNETDLICLFRANVFSCENHVERSAGSNQAWKSLRAPCAGNQSELNFRKCEHRFRVIARDSIGRCKRQLQRPAEASAMYRADQWRAHSLDRIQQQLTFVTHSLGVCCGFQLEEFVDVCAGDPAVFFSA